VYPVSTKKRITSEIVIDQPTYVTELVHGISLDNPPTTPVTKELTDREGLGGSVD
jgi:hypothetical protein